MKNTNNVNLFPTDFVIIKEDNTPLRYASNEIGLWSQVSIDGDEINLEQGETFVSSDQIEEPYRTELLNQLNNYILKL